MKTYHLLRERLITLKIIPLVIAILTLSSCKELEQELCGERIEMDLQYTGTEINSDWSRTTGSDHRLYSTQYFFAACVDEDEPLELTQTLSLDPSEFRSDLPMETLIFVTADEFSYAETIGQGTVTSGSSTHYSGKLGSSTHQNYTVSFRIMVYGSASSAEKDQYVQDLIETCDLHVLYPEFVH